MERQKLLAVAHSFHVDLALNTLAPGWMPAARWRWDGLAGRALTRQRALVSADARAVLASVHAHAGAAVLAVSSGQVC
jgi:hypothetical protein